MQKPVKKFGGGLMKAVSKAMPQIKKAVEASSGVPPEAIPTTKKVPVPSILGGFGVMGPTATAGKASGVMGRVAKAAAEAAKKGPVATARTPSRGLLGKAAQAAAAAVAKRARPTGMKKGGAVIKKAAKKTTRKK